MRRCLPYQAGTAITMCFGWNLSVLVAMYLGAGIPEDWARPWPVAWASFGL